MVFITNGRSSGFWAKSRIWETYIHHSELDSFLILKVLFTEIDSDKQLWFLKIYNELFHHLGDLHTTSGNQYFQVANAWYYHNHASVNKRLLRMYARPMEYNVMECGKFIDVVSEYTVKITFKKWLIVKFLA